MFIFYIRVVAIGGGGGTGHFRPLGKTMALNVPPGSASDCVGVKIIYIRRRGCTRAISRDYVRETVKRHIKARYETHRFCQVNG